MSNIQLDYSDITDIFKEKLKIDNIVKKVSSIFLNQRYAGKIDYKPYFQRNYVWDEEKATYFIESILLGTEIPPLVLFQTKDKNEVIDGRQRYETIKRFLEDKLVLKGKGLHSLKMLAGKKYSQLDEDTRELFEDTRIRILQFNVVDEPKLDEEKEEKIKKEIFRRYNSGITPLQKYDIDRAAYIDDNLSNQLYNKIYNDSKLYDFLCEIILPKSKKKASKRDKVNIVVSLVRNLITLPLIPIYSYSKGSSKAEIICKYYYAKVANENELQVIDKFCKVITYLVRFNTACKKKNIYLCNNNLFYEVLYWAIDIVLENNGKISDDSIETAFEYINNADNYPELWNHIINNPQKSMELIFESTGSHYYSAINNRYNFIANIFQNIFEIDFQKYLKNPDDFSNMMESASEKDEISHYKINKPLPETLTIEDIISDMKKSRFLIRPNYQRSEVKNIQKASYLLESILLGINLPPLFIYKRKDKIKEVVDGQQRLLAILGFLGKTYVDERGETVCTDKDKFRLSKLKILSELNGKTIETVGDKFEEKILEFPMDIIEIDAEQNPDFSQIDLFLRLNTKPYPIKENTFEMWNAYIDKDIVIKVKEIAAKYEKTVFRARDTRMKLEELITSLGYLDYRMNQPNTEIINLLNLYKRNDRMCARIMSKDNVTKTLSELSNSNPKAFVKSLENVELFVSKILILIENSPAKLRDLFNHSKKGVQYKTDQNFYFLWAMLFKISIEELQKRRQEEFERISKVFSLIQKTPVNYSTEIFLREL
ncbi:DUF262 domain-containing protein [Anaerostipes faecalis]|uniref:DUF262 domain-containing protein n=1 Tax=Anaerostipes faecalis TaxID=2738446 RepID=UPI003F129B06